MKRSSERLIDAAVLAMLLIFAYVMRTAQPGLSGVIIASAVNFWMVKNATGLTPAEKINEDSADAAAAALLRAEQRLIEKESRPEEVEIVGQSDAVEVDVVEKKPEPS